MHLEFWIFFSNFWKLLLFIEVEFHVWREPPNLMWWPWVVQTAPSRCANLDFYLKRFRFITFQFEQPFSLIPFFPFFPVTVRYWILCSQLEFWRCSLTSTAVITVYKAKMELACDDPCQQTKQKVFYLDCDGKFCESTFWTSKGSGCQN